MKTRRCGSRSGWLTNPSRRRFKMSRRSAARAVLFPSKAMAAKEAPQRPDAEAMSPLRQMCLQPASVMSSCSSTRAGSAPSARRSAPSTGPRRAASQPDCRSDFCGRTSGSRSLRSPRNVPQPSAATDRLKPQATTRSRSSRDKPFGGLQPGRQFKPKFKPLGNPNDSARPKIAQNHQISKPGGFLWARASHFLVEYPRGPSTARSRHVDCERSNCVSPTR